MRRAEAGNEQAILRQIIKDTRAGVERAQSAGKITERDADGTDVADARKIHGARNGVEGSVELLERQTIFAGERREAINHHQIKDADGNQATHDDAGNGAARVRGFFAERGDAFEAGEGHEAENHRELKAGYFCPVQVK